MKHTTLEGRNVVVEALKRNRKIFEIKIDQGATGDKISDILGLAKSKRVITSFVSRKELDKLSKTDAHQGIIALAEPIKTVSLSDVLLKKKDPFIVVLREVLYEHNLGAVLRSASAAGADAIVVPPTQGNTISPVVERVSMGASNSIDVVALSTHSALSVLKKNGVKIVGVEITGDSYYFESDLTGPIALVFGGEDTGLSLPISQKCDIVVRVPMINDIQSLNQSVAVSIVLFEKVRQEIQK